MNLYGSIAYDRLKSFYMIHMEEVTQPLLDEEVLDVLFIGQFVKMHPYYFDGEYFYAQFYSEEDEEIGRQIADNGKPYYLPSYDVFIRYASTGYVEETYEYKAMEDFIRRHVTSDDIKVENFMISLGYICEYMGMNGAVEELEEMGYVFNSDQEFHRFAMLYQAFNNNTRMWSNHGYTPSELSGIRPKKVGRNEPCPCGSGKKFKKCCGSPLRSVK
ncbi:hypothetical protein EZV73_12365 [Acidaminobacter sp. JC074]|nr:hypothetical protein [Acidaminobacter sp. JC074]